MGLLTQSVQKGLGLRSSASSRGYSAFNTAYQAAQIDRLTEDWVVATLSPDQEIRMALRNLRGRARQLAINNPHCKHFLDTMEEQVIGANGISIELAFAEPFLGSDVFCQQVESAFHRWSEKCTADQKMGLPEYSRLWLRTFLGDGEVFTNKIKGYPYNPSNFALQLVDADQVDINWMRLKSPGSTDGLNEIRMGVEVDDYRRAVAYWLYSGHPSEFAAVKRERIPAEQIEHAYAMRRVNQTRGVPAMHAAMFLMNMLGEYDKAEVVASRWAATKMAFLVSKTGDEYNGGAPDGKKKDGPMIVDAQPGMFEELPEGIKPEVVDWQHPTKNYEAFSLAVLRGIAVGVNSSYSTLTGDLRSVNFSSIRQGILTERDSYACVQQFAVANHVRPTFRSWLPMAVLTGQIALPHGIEFEDVFAALRCTPRGWDWVDPNKDVQASTNAIRANLTTHRDECAKRGKDWRKIFQQRKAELDFAKELGIPMDLTTSGAGGVEGDMGQEDPERGAEPTKGSGSPQKGNQ